MLHASELARNDRAIRRIAAESLSVQVESWLGAFQHVCLSPPGLPPSAWLFTREDRSYVLRILGDFSIELQTAPEEAYLWPEGIRISDAFLIEYRLRVFCTADCRSRPLVPMQEPVIPPARFVTSVLLSSENYRKEMLWKISIAWSLGLLEERPLTQEEVREYFPQSPSELLEEGYARLHDGTQGFLREMDQREQSFRRIYGHDPLTRLLADSGNL